MRRHTHQEAVERRHTHTHTHTHHEAVELRLAGVEATEFEKSLATTEDFGTFRADKGNASTRMRKHQAAPMTDTYETYLLLPLLTH